MKYLADDSDYGGFSFNGNSSGPSNSFPASAGGVDDRQRSLQSTTNPFDSAARRLSSASTSSQQHGGNYGGGQSDLASMDDILSFLDK